MDTYDPITRIQAEIDLPTAAPLVELCTRFFTATTGAEFDAIIETTEALMLQRPEPNDPLQLLLTQLLDRSRQHALLLQCVTDWATQHVPAARIIELIPERWQAELQTPAEQRFVSIQHAWDMDDDAYQAIIVER